MAGLPGLRGSDHIGFTVPDLDAAERFLVDVIGATPVYTLGGRRADDDWMSTQLGVHPRSAIREIRFYRLAVFVPVVVSTIATSIMFLWLFDPNFGLANWILGRFGLGPFGFFTSSDGALYSIIAMTVWGWIGFDAIIYLAALQGVPRSLYEAAAMDGANRWQEFRNVTLPGIRSVLVFIVSTTIISSMNMFGQSYLMTAGGPGNETRTAIMQISATGLRQFDSGMASAMSMIFMFFLVLISGSVFWLTNRDSDAKSGKKSKARATT